MATGTRNRGWALRDQPHLQGGVSTRGVNTTQTMCCEFHSNGLAFVKSGARMPKWKKITWNTLNIEWYLRQDLTFSCFVLFIRVRPSNLVICIIFFYTSFAWIKYCWKCVWLRNFTRMFSALPYKDTLSAGVGLIEWLSNSSFLLQLISHASSLIIPPLLRKNQILFFCLVSFAGQRWSKYRRIW